MFACMFEWVSIGYGIEVLKTKWDNKLTKIRYAVGSNFKQENLVKGFKFAFNKAVQHSGFTYENLYDGAWMIADIKSMWTAR